jgi:GT2 family glycosyltransferase
MESSCTSPLQLSVSIVLHNSSPELLCRTIDSLQRSVGVARRAGCVGQVSVDIVDNSVDSAYQQQVHRVLAAQPQDEFFRLKYSAQTVNQGFGPGHNSVIKDADSDYHLILNPDVELQDDTLHLGLAFMESDHGVALLSPRVWGSDGQQEFLCKRYPSVLALLLRGFAPAFISRLFRKRLDHYEMRDVCAGEQSVDVVLASGCFMLVPTKALRASGGFSDDYFLYFEDFDLSLRLGGQGRLVFNPAMQIVHHGGYAASKGFKHVKYFIKSGITFFNQHGWRWI